jgi:hypothetical protein
MNEKNIIISQNNVAGISGEYLIQVIKSDGSVEFPFGQEKRKNLILDSFFRAILTGYKFGIQSFVQTCRVGNNIQAPVRTNTGLVGTILGQTYKSDNFISQINSQNNTISLTRDFIFDAIPGGIGQVSYAEALIGSFAINEISEIATSRFVFPGTLILQSGDRLKVQYTLTIYLPYLNSDLPITLTGDGLNFTGKVRLSSNVTGIIGQLSGSKTYVGLGDSDTTVFRDYTANSNAFSTTTEFQEYGRYQNIFGTPLWANNIGFYPSGHIPANYPTGRLDYTPTGSRATLTTGLIDQNDNYSSVPITYYFPPFSGDRSVGGIYLWHHNTGSSYSAIYYSFNSGQVIPSGLPVTITLDWRFSRS